MTRPDETLLARRRERHGARNRAARWEDTRTADCNVFETGEVLTGALWTFEVERISLLEHWRANWPNTALPAHPQPAAMDQ